MTMARNYKIGIIGKQDAILPYRIIGFDLFPILESEEAKRIIDELAANDYGIIFITEEIAKDIPETISAYDTEVLPAIILLPTHEENLGIGLQRIRDNVEKAVGADIL